MGWGWFPVDISHGQGESSPCITILYTDLLIFAVKQSQHKPAAAT